SHRRGRNTCNDISGTSLDKNIRVCLPSCGGPPSGPRQGHRRERAVRQGDGVESRRRDMDGQGKLSMFGSLRAVCLLPALFLSALALLLLVPSLASAAFIKRGSVSAFSDPRGVAVEQSTGNVFVVDPVNDRVYVRNSDGTALTQFGGPTQLDNPRSIAIWESGGETEVYVADAGGRRIVRYLSDEAPVPKFTVDATYTSPGHGI